MSIYGERLLGDLLGNFFCW